MNKSIKGDRKQLVEHSHQNFKKKNKKMMKKIKIGHVES